MNYKLTNKWASIIDNKIDVLECINIFDKGFERIYVVDSDNNFNGMIIDKNKFHNIWTNSDNSEWYRFLSINEVITDVSNDSIFNYQLEHIIENFEDNEIPIVLNNKIETIVVIKSRIECDKYNWNLRNFEIAIDYLSKNKSICLSSLMTQNSKNFYNKYIPFINIVVLNESNIDLFVKGEIDLFIYEEDVYQNLDINKISLKEIYSKFLNEYKERKRHELHIEQDWATLNINECSVIECIRLFDKGYNSIYLEDNDKNFVATVCRHNFKEDLLQSNFGRWDNVFVEYTSDEQSLMNELISSYIGTARQDIPIIKDKKVVASCCKKDYYYSDAKLKWEYISISAVKKYFGDMKILLSSSAGEIGIFYYKFKEVIDAEVFEETSLPRYFSGEYDVVIFNSDIWCNKRCISLDIYQLYLDLLGEYVENRLRDKQVDFYYFESIYNTNEVLNWGKRFYDGHISSVIPIIDRIYKKQGIAYINNDFDSELCHIKNGIRRTVGRPLDSKNNICFYGACTSLGLYVSDENTIESKLQIIINKENIPYSVINVSGMFGTSISKDINSLYLILNEKFNSNDIVIQIGFHMWNSELGSKLQGKRYYRLADVYNKGEYCYSRIFMDWSPHLTAEGNELVANYIYQVLKPRMITNE